MAKRRPKLDHLSMDGAIIARMCHLYIDREWNLQAIGREMDMSHGKVRRVLMDFGVPLRSVGRRAIESDFTPDQLDLIKRAYVNLEWAPERIGVAFYSNGPTVLKNLRQEGVAIRPQHLGGARHDRKAIEMVQQAIKDGTLVRQPCEVCNASPYSKGRAYTIAHHDDYNHPLKVRWLCPVHHRLWHQTNTAIRKGESGEGE